MSSLTNSYESQVYDWLFRPAQSPTRPSALYLALFTAASDIEAGTVTEVSGGSYARVDVSSAFSAPTAGAGSNSGDVTFPAPTANWGTVTHFGLFTASSGGTLIAAAALSASRVINNGDAAPKFSTGQLTIAVA